MQYIKIQRGDITVGDKLPWTVYDGSGKLLLQEGYTVKTEKLLEGLLAAGHYAAEVDETSNLIVRTTFSTIHDIQGKLSDVLNRFSLGTERESSKVVLSHYIAQIVELCDLNPDAMIASVHLFSERPYSITHSIHMAILSALLSQQVTARKINQASMIGAALTCNVAMLKLQDMLEEQLAPLSQEQEKEIHEHPVVSVGMLKSYGISDRTWLDTVRYHHEAVNGTGYPMACSANRIPLEAKILACIDYYSAKVTSRSGRKALEPPEALRTIFIEKGKTIDDELALQFIRMMGIYPPGTFVLLKNGDRAIVVRRPESGSQKMHPIVCSYKDSEGQPYDEPVFYDSSLPQYKIEKICRREKLPFDYDRLWAV